MLSAIQGKTAGANITSATGGPGGSTRIVLRGEKSIGQNNNALIVIDGIPVNNTSRLQGRSGLSEIDFGNRGNDINPEDIESITVLRGAGAAALYGQDGAFGAVMITTKSGRSRRQRDRTEVTYQTSYTFHNILRYPELQNRYGQGNLAGVVDDRRENFSWGQEFDGKDRPFGQIINGQSLVKPYSAQPDNIRDFYRTGGTWENNVSLAGGNDNSALYLSFNSQNHDGVTPNTFYNKYSIRLNASTQLSNRFYATTNINFLTINQRVEQQGQRFGAVWENVIQTPRDAPLAEAKNYNDPFYGYGFVDSAGVPRYGYFNAYALNPFWVADKFENRNRTNRLLGNAIVGYRLGDGFEIFNRFGGDVVSDEVESRIPKFNYEPYDPFYEGLPQNSNGGLYAANLNSVFINNDLIARYRKLLSEEISLDALVGYNIRAQRSSSLISDIDPENNGLVIPDFYSFTNATGPVQTTNTLSQIRGTAAYGSLSMGYANQLFLELTGRNDWSSLLAEGNRSFFYPSANLSWVFSETFSNDNFFGRTLSFGKLRASYASVGGSGTTAYLNNDPAFTRGSISTGFGTVELPFNGVPGYTFQGTIGNPGLRPERTNSWEVGTELSFFRDRITVDATYYESLSIDQIVAVPRPSSTGFESQVVNLGDISNKGLEIQARVTPIANRSRGGLRWDLFGTYFKNRSLVERLAAGASQVTFPGTQTTVAVTATVGRPFGAFYVVDIDRTEDGRVIVDSATGLPLQGANPIYKGTYQPRFLASWGTTLSFRGFALNVLFDTKQGGIFYSSTKDLLNFVGAAKETEDRAPRVWEGSVYEAADGSYVTNTTAYDPYEYYTNAIPDGQHIVDATYVKLREASLYYSVPEGPLKNTPFGALSVGVFGSNLFLWTPDSNMYVDPEMNASGSTNVQGYDFRARSSLRNYGISVRVSF